MRVPSCYLHMSNADGASVRAKVGWRLAGEVLALDAEKLGAPYREGLASAQAALRRNLRAGGANLDVYAALRDVVGADALVRYVALGDTNLFDRRLFSTPLPGDIEGLRTVQRRESEPPSTLLTMPGSEGFPAIPVIVTRDPDDPNEFSEWGPYLLAMEALGATDKGIKMFAKSYSYCRERHRIRVNGRIERLYCLPLGMMLVIARLLDAMRGEFLRQDRGLGVAGPTHGVSWRLGVARNESGRGTVCRWALAAPATDSE